MAGLYVRGSGISADSYSCPTGGDRDAPADSCQHIPADSYPYAGASANRHPTATPSDGNEHASATPSDGNEHASATLSDGNQHGTADVYQYANGDAKSDPDF